MKYLVQYLVECPVKSSMSKCKLYIGDLAYQGDTPLNPPVRANASFISEMLSEMSVEMLDEMPSRMLNEMISEMFDEMHNRMLSRMLDEIPCRMPSRMLDRMLSEMLDEMLNEMSNRMLVFWLFCFCDKYAFLVPSSETRCWCFAEMLKLICKRASFNNYDLLCTKILA